MVTRHSSHMFTTLLLLALTIVPSLGEWRGGDVSLLPDVEQAQEWAREETGNEYNFYNRYGQVQDVPGIFRDNHFNTVRIHLFHEPTGKCCDEPQAIQLAKRMQAEGNDIILDFHFSDDWGNGGNQKRPAAWDGMNFEQLTYAIKAYTRDTLNAFHHAGIDPIAVQLGNEMAGGILYPVGKIWGNSDTDNQWRNLGYLLGNATQGLRDSYAPMPEVILHTQEGGKYDLCSWFFRNLRERSTYDDYDIIGLSFYPWWQGTLDDLRDNIPRLKSTFGKKVAVVETGYPWTLDANDEYDNNFVKDASQLHAGYPASPEGQRRWVKDIRQLVQDCGGLGVLYWAPEWISVRKYGTLWENVALFNFNGEELPSVEEMGRPLTTPPPPPAAEDEAKKLVTTTVGGNGSNGAMFDIKAKNDISIFTFDILAKQGSYTVEVYTRPGGYRGAESNPGAWTRILRETIHSGGTDSVTTLPWFNPVVVAANAKQGFYIRLSSSSLVYTNGNSVGAVFREDSNIQFMEGLGVSGSFGRNYKPRVFNGGIHYRRATGTPAATSQTSLRTLDTTTVAPVNNGSGGNQFDIRAKNKIRIDGFGISVKPGTHVVEVYSKSGSYDGHEQNRNEWYLIQTATVTSTSEHELTQLPSLDNTDFEVWAGVTTAFYIRTKNSHSIKYVTGSNLGGVYKEDSNLQVFEGAGVTNGSGDGFGNFYEPRVFAGSIRYEKID